jgi:tungstate transport system permease protein
VAQGNRHDRYGASFVGRRFPLPILRRAIGNRNRIPGQLVDDKGESPIDEILRGLTEAVRLLVSRDPALFEIVLLSLQVSGTALLFSTVIGIPLGAAMGLSRFVGRRLLIALLYTGMGFPPVVVGLFVYLILSRSGPLGQLDSSLIPALFTPGAMVVAQTIISFPLVAGFTMAAVMGVDPALRQQVQALGATRWQTTLAILTEARVGVIVAVIAGFGSIISEVGAVMMVGGNIEHKTRVLTTAIVLETRKGNFDLAMAIGIVLLGLAFLTNLAMLRIQGRTFDE